MPPTLFHFFTFYDKHNASAKELDININGSLLETENIKFLAELIVMNGIYRVEDVEAKRVCFESLVSKM